jgi:hypothetical protein
MRLTTAFRTTLARALGQCATVTARWAAQLEAPPASALEASRTGAEGTSVGGPPSHWVEKVRLAAPHLLEPAPPAPPPRPDPRQQSAPAPAGGPPAHWLEYVRAAGSSPLSPFPAQWVSASGQTSEQDTHTSDTDERRSEYPSPGEAQTGDSPASIDPPRPSGPPGSAARTAASSESQPHIRHVLPLRPLPRSRPASDISAITPDVTPPDAEQSLHASDASRVVVREDAPVGREMTSVRAPLTLPVIVTLPAQQPEPAHPSPVFPRSGRPVGTAGAAVAYDTPTEPSRPSPDLTPLWPTLQPGVPAPMSWDAPGAPIAPLQWQGVAIAGNWPELPETPAATVDDARVLLRAWERARRLEREQRGE